MSADASHRLFRKCENAKSRRSLISSSKKFLFSASGTKGDLFPLIGIACELKSRGFSIAFMTNDYYRDLVEDYGLCFLSTGTAEQHVNFHSDERTWNPKLDAAEIGFDGLIKPAMTAACSHVFQQYESNAILGVVSTYPLLNGAALAAEALGIPAISVTLSPRYLPSDIAPCAPLRWMLPDWLPGRLRVSVSRALRLASQKRVRSKPYVRELNRMWCSMGLKEISSLSPDELFPRHHLQLAMFPGWYGMRSPDWPPLIATMGFPLFDQVDVAARQVADDFIEVQGSPVVFTSGTGISDTAPIFHEAEKICDSLEVPGLFVGSVKGSFQPRRTSILRLDYVDFEHVLPRCLAIVHHGGIGTLAQAVRAGIPQLIRPLAFDQFDNADRVHRLGLGTFVLPKQFHANRVAAIVRRLVVYRQANSLIQRYSLAVKRSKAIPRACDLIERHVSNSRDSSVF